MFLQNTYFEKNKNLIEDFFVIGVDREYDLPRLETQYQHKSPDTIYAPSKVLYIHSGKEQCQRRNVVKDFCYPNESSMQVILEKLKEKESVEEILYG